MSRWFSQCLREQALLLEVLFLYYAYFEMPSRDLLTFARLFKEQGFGQRQTNRHLVDKSMDALVDRIGFEKTLSIAISVYIRTNMHSRYVKLTSYCLIIQKDLILKTRLNTSGKNTHYSNLVFGINFFFSLYIFKAFF